MWWLCWIMTISIGKFVVMVLVTWRQPKLTNNDFKWQKISLLCKKLMNEEGKAIVLTTFSSHKCASKRKQTITSWPMPLASPPSYIGQCSFHLLIITWDCACPHSPPFRKLHGCHLWNFQNYLKSRCFSLDRLPIFMWQPVWHYSENTQKPPLPLNTICALIDKPCYETKYIMQ